MRDQKKEEGDYPFGVEDLLYYVKKAEEQQFNFDFGDLKQYFPVNLILSGVFKIAQDLFGIYSFYYSGISFNSICFKYQNIKSTLLCPMNFFISLLIVVIDW